MRRSYTSSRFAIPFVLGGALAGCAHAPPDGALAELKQHLTEANRKEAEGRHRIDELENRVFLLTDQLETQKVAAATTRSPRLPVVTLRPTEESVLAVEPRRAEEPRPEEDIEFTGAARSVDAHHVRPVLRGDGPGPGIAEVEAQKVRRSHTVGASASPPSESARLVTQQAGDSLGVAPVPPISKALGERSSSAPTKISAPAMSAAIDRAPIDNEPLSAYRVAYAEVAAGRFDEGEQKLRAFIRRFPRHDYADNAQYWIGECFYARHMYREAAVEFRTAVAKYPVGNKAPDALLKLSYSLLSLGDTREARKLLEELPATYPRSEAARLATQKLTDLHVSAGRPVEEHR